MPKKLLQFITYVTVAILILVGTAEQIKEYIWAQITTRVLYVNASAGGQNDGSSWSDAFTNLQAALALAEAGDEIWVAAGTYRPTGGFDRTIAFELVDGARLYGGFAGTETTRTERNWETNVTILSGNVGFDDEQTDNSYNVVRGVDIGTATVVDGFVIQHGYASGPADNRGGGMLLTNSSPLLNNLELVENWAWYGAGMQVISGTPAIASTVFISNHAYSAGGGLHTVQGNPTIKETIFEGNVAENGCGGGIYHNGGDPQLFNVVLLRNQATEGGGLCSGDGRPLLVNTVIVGNTTSAFDSQGGGINAGSWSEGPSGPILRNSIVWNNAAYREKDIYPSDLDVSYSLVEGDYEGTANRGHDPLFVDVAAGNLRVQASSVAIDGGTNEACAPIDLVGNARPWDGNSDGFSTCDIGVHEYNAPQATATSTPTNTPTTTPSPTVTDTPVPTSTPTTTPTPRAVHLPLVVNVPTPTPTTTPSPSPTPTPTATSTTPPPVPVGLRVRFRAWDSNVPLEGRVTHAEHRTILYDNRTPVYPEGIFVVLLMDVTNEGLQSGAVGLYSSFKVQDDIGRQFDMAELEVMFAAEETYDRESVYTTIQPGFTRQIVLVFDVLPESQGFELLSLSPW